jgi:hypothetical protein
VVGGGREQFGHAALQHGVAQFGRDFVEWNQDEAALGEARVGNDEVRRMDDAGAVEEDIDINRAMAQFRKGRCSMPPTGSVM